VPQGRDPREEPLPLRLLDRVTHLLNFVGSVLIFGLVVLVGADIFGRNVLSRPLMGVAEIVSISIVVIVFLQIPHVARMRRISRSEFFEVFLTRRAPRLVPVLSTVFDVLSILMVAAVVWGTWPLLQRSLRLGEYFGAIGSFTAPTWPIRVAILVGGSCLILQLMAQIWRTWTGRPAR
jgi:TRAP-type mannitol/chloroaromatic compound transport system permease small subunit